jgi:hypothetical protein
VSVVAAAASNSPVRVSSAAAASSPLHNYYAAGGSSSRVGSAAAFDGTFASAGGAMGGALSASGAGYSNYTEAALRQVQEAKDLEMRRVYEKVLEVDRTVDRALLRTAAHR